LPVPHFVCCWVLSCPHREPGRCPFSSCRCDVVGLIVATTRFWSLLAAVLVPPSFESVFGSRVLFLESAIELRPDFLPHQFSLRAETARFQLQILVCRRVYSGSRSGRRQDFSVHPVLGPSPSQLRSLVSSQPGLLISSSVLEICFPSKPSCHKSVVPCVFVFKWPRFIRVPRVL
jgi:hypothetical protein